MKILETRSQLYVHPIYIQRHTSTYWIEIWPFARTKTGLLSETSFRCTASKEANFLPPCFFLLALPPLSSLFLLLHLPPVDLQAPDFDAVFFSSLSASEFFVCLLLDFLGV